MATIGPYIEPIESKQPKGNTEMTYKNFEFKGKQYQASFGMNVEIRRMIDGKGAGYLKRGSVLYLKLTAHIGA
jgi:hypothetical protein